METTDFEPPEPLMILQDLETLKLVADPLRNQILEIVASGPMTINQVAEMLGLQASKLYYHFNMLERHGLLRVVDTQVKGNIIEKRYWLTALKLKLDDSLCNFNTPAGQEASITSMVSLLETTRDDLERSLRARAYALEQGAEMHPRPVTIYRELRNVSDETAEAFIDRLHDIMEEFSGLNPNSGDPEGHTRALTIAFYPSFYYEPPGDASGE